MTDKKKDTSKSRADQDASGVQGEGNAVADARYRKKTKEYLAKNDPQEAGEKARKDLAGASGDELRAAEAEAKSRRRSKDR